MCGVSQLFNCATVMYSPQSIQNLPLVSIFVKVSTSELGNTLFSFALAFASRFLIQYCLSTEFTLCAP